VTEDDRLDEIVFGPPSHAETPHKHAHLTTQERMTGSPHEHAHYHQGGWANHAGVHKHLHWHPEAEK
jgi:hypothetical protein